MINLPKVPVCATLTPEKVKMFYARSTRSLVLSNFPIPIELLTFSGGKCNICICHALALAPLLTDSLLRSNHPHDLRRLRANQPPPIAQDGKIALLDPKRSESDALLTGWLTDACGGVSYHMQFSLPSPPPLRMQ